MRKFKIVKITFSKSQSWATYDISKNKPLVYPKENLKNVYLRWCFLTISILSLTKQRCSLKICMICSLCDESISPFQLWCAAANIASLCLRPIHTVNDSFFISFLFHLRLFTLGAFMVSLISIMVSWEANQNGIYYLNVLGCVCVTWRMLLWPLSKAWEECIIT